MSRFFTLLAVSLFAIAFYQAPLDAGRYHPNVSVAIGVGYSQPPYYYGRPYPAGYYGGCPRYARRIPPVYAYPHTVYYGPPGIIYEEIYPYPPRCGGWYY